MNGLALCFLVVNAIAIVTLPRRWALLPLLIGASYMTAAQNITLGPFHFTVLRVLVLAGFLRAFFRGERLHGGLNGLDGVLLAWGAWAICSAVFHKPMGEALVFRLGAVYNAVGIYFLVRLLCRTSDDLVQMGKVMALLLVPIALEMLGEKLRGRNLFAFFGGVPIEVMLRDGRLRAQGPFGHPILAGTVGALLVPVMAGIWGQHPRSAKLGLAACLAIVLASTSSGPIMSVGFGVVALLLWRWRDRMRRMRLAIVAGYIFLELVMKDPAYFILARIDLTGSSTGWYRAQLIRSAFQHLREWWLVGTDYTRDWMVTGVSWSEDHCDITNQYLYYGVWGGLPLMLLFIWALKLGFGYVGEALRSQGNAPMKDQFLIWSLGAGLFVHAATGVSVAYFDQSVIFLYLNLAAIGSLRASALALPAEETVPSLNGEATIPGARWQGGPA